MRAYCAPQAFDPRVLLESASQHKTHWSVDTIEKSTAPLSKLKHHTHNDCKLFEWYGNLGCRSALHAPYKPMGIWFLH
eukprot:766865-Amphidinium_carterae.1